jgi:hypothetical protein
LEARINDELINHLSWKYLLLVACIPINALLVVLKIKLYLKFNDYKKATNVSIGMAQKKRPSLEYYGCINLTCKLKNLKDE